MTSDDPTALHRRARLPEALRFLLADYPRRIWGDHPNFGPTTKFYLDRHAMFRECFAVMRRLTGEGLDGARPGTTFARDFARLGGFFLQELQTHHGIEDHHYFPALQRLEPRLTRGFEILDRDHHALHEALGRFHGAAETALRAARAPGDPKRAIGALDAELARFDPFLDRHLHDEEEIVIPVMLDRGEAALGL
ncbi:MAG TPA: hemerythrin domain-containing protein [Paracoccaceae bacterium]|nr:hemerythrin domain-containing protein [Paracoccaceae bacterium]